MSMMITKQDGAAFSRHRAEEKLEFHLIYAFALMLFLVAALVQMFLPRAWRVNPEQPLFRGAFSAARTVSKFAFMG